VEFQGLQRAGDGEKLASQACHWMDTRIISCDTSLAMCPIRCIAAVTYSCLMLSVLRMKAATLPCSSLSEASCA